MPKPLAVLNSSIKSRVMVELRHRKEFRGILDGFDPHMNLVLRNATEYCERELVREYDLVIVRGDNVIYISP